MELDVVILAGGQGKRMHSATPKVLHQFAGVPMLERAYHSAKQLNPAQIHIVYSPKVPQVRDAMSHLDVNWIPQQDSLGTGHALLVAAEGITENHRVLSINGDSPILPVDLLSDLLKITPAEGLGIVTAMMDEPTGYGRIIRNSIGNIVGVIEELDASQIQRQIKEVYAGILTAPGHQLKSWLRGINNGNKQNEYYLSDIVEVVIKHGVNVDGVVSAYINEVRGINNLCELTDLERFYYRKIAQQLMSTGTTIRNPDQFYLRGNLVVGKDVVIDVNIIIEGNVSIGDNSFIGPNTILHDVNIGQNVLIQGGCVIENTEIPDNTFVRSLLCQYEISEA